MTDNARTLLGLLVLTLGNALLAALYDWAFFAAVDPWRVGLFLTALELAALFAWVVMNRAF